MTRKGGGTSVGREVLKAPTPSQRLGTARDAPVASHAAGATPLLSICAAFRCDADPRRARRPRPLAGAGAARPHGRERALPTPPTLPAEALPAQALPAEAPTAEGPCGPRPPCSDAAVEPSPGGSPKLPEPPGLPGPAPLLAEAPSAEAPPAEAPPARRCGQRGRLPRRRPLRRSRSMPASPTIDRAAASPATPGPGADARPLPARAGSLLGVLAQLSSAPRRPTGPAALPAAALPAETLPAEALPADALLVGLTMARRDDLEPRRCRTRGAVPLLPRAVARALDFALQSLLRGAADTVGAALRSGRCAAGLAARSTWRHSHRLPSGLGAAELATWTRCRRDRRDGGRRMRQDVAEAAED